MDVLIISKEEILEIKEKIDHLTQHVISLEEKICPDLPNPEDVWVDNYDVCTFLKISEKTLQRLRVRGDISYSKVSGKIYYTLADIKKMLLERKVKRTLDHYEELVKNQKLYVEQRRNTKKD